MNEDDKIRIEIVSGVEGSCLVVNNYRVAGPKPWGGGSITKTWVVSREDLMRSIDSAMNMPIKEK